MISYVQGNMFAREADIYVNPVNCVGVMGAGIAAQFKKKYPNMFAEYKQVCLMKEIDIGKCHVWYGPQQKVAVVNLPTKKHWKDPSLIEYVEAGLKDLADTCKDINHGVTMCVPALGCGLGGLEWDEVKPLMEKYLKELPCNVLIFEPI